MKKVLLLAIIAIFFWSCSCSNTNSVDLKASIGFNGTQFVIQNTDSFDYVNAKLKVNDDYILDGVTIPAGKTYTVGMMQFSDDKGNRFDYMKKPKTFIISCKLDNDKYGFVSATWN